MAASFAFDRFVLDTADRRLQSPDGPVEVNGRYFDALALLVAHQGKLVSKDHFLSEVWRGVPVTDEALTQCIKTLRRELGDNASSPRFIETVPKHGYRFIAPVRRVDGTSAKAPTSGDPARWWEITLTGLAGTLGGIAAGVIGGLIYGFLGALQPAQGGVGALSTMVVILCITVVVGIMGAAGVSFPIGAAALLQAKRHWLLVSGAAGGLVVGAAVKLVGLDAFTLLVGRAPRGITGAMEGLLLGTGVGMSAWLAFPRGSLGKAAAIAVPLGAISGMSATLLGGHLLLGSLVLLEGEFKGSRLRVDRIGALFGEGTFGPVTQLMTSALEGALFCGCVVVAMTYAQKRLGQVRN